MKKYDPNKVYKFRKQIIANAGEVFNRSTVNAWLATGSIEEMMSIPEAVELPEQIRVGEISNFALATEAVENDEYLAEKINEIICYLKAKE